MLALKVCALEIDGRFESHRDSPIRIRKKRMHLQAFEVLCVTFWLLIREEERLGLSVGLKAQGSIHSAVVLLSASHPRALLAGPKLGMKIVVVSVARMTTVSRRAPSGFC